MNEINQNLPPSLRSAMDTFYTTPQPDSAFAEGLEAQLRQHQIELTKADPAAASSKQKPGSLHLTHRSSFMHMLRTRPFLTLIAAILALLLLTGIAYAAGRLTGFIPGIGFVQDVHSVLETPVVVKREIVNTPMVSSSGQEKTKQVTQSPTSGSAIDNAQSELSATPVTFQERKGITVTIERAVSEAHQLVISYKVTGLPADLFGPERIPTLQAYTEAHPDEPMQVQVRLLDGTLLKHGDGGHCSGAGDVSTAWLTCRSVFSPLPDGVNQFTLEIHQLQNALPGELPEDWRIPIQLSPVTAAQAGNGIQEPNLRSQTVAGIMLRLDKAVQTTDQTAFQLSMTWEGTNRFVRNYGPFTLQDELGRYYILSGGPEGGAYTIDNPNFTTLPSMVTSPVDGSSPLTFRMDWVSVSASTRGGSADGGAAIFTFDPGTAAKVGQEWTIDQTFPVNEFNLHFTKARLKAAQDGTFILEFDIQAPSAVSMVNLVPKDDSSPTTESGFDKTRGGLVSRVMLPALPAQPIDLYISEVVYKVNGPWEITWQPQRLNGTFPTPTAAPTRLAPPPTVLNSSAPLLAEAQELLNKASIPNGPGWVHQVIQMDQAAPVGILDTGDQPEQPLQMTTDAWFLLDEQGFARTTVIIRKTPDGKLASADIDNGVYHFRFPEGHGNVSQDIYLAKPTYYYDPLTTINSYITEGGKVSRESTTVDGKTCQQYTGTRTYNPPMILWGEPAPVIAMTYSACIDPVTGAVLQIQDQMDYADGTHRIKDTTRFVSLEKVETLPDEVRQLLDKIAMP